MHQVELESLPTTRLPRPPCSLDAEAIPHQNGLQSALPAHTSGGAKSPSKLHGEVGLVVKRLPPRTCAVRSYSRCQGVRSPPVARCPTLQPFGSTRCRRSSLIVILNLIFTGPSSCATKVAASPSYCEIPSIAGHKKGSHEADVSVDSVRTPFGRTNTAITSSATCERRLP